MRYRINLFSQEPETSFRTKSRMEVWNKGFDDHCSLRHDADSHSVFVRAPVPPIAVF